MSVSLNPSNALGFRRPLTQLVKRSLTITNHNSQPVVFKVKTTAPKLYCVRPNSGRVEPGDSVEVSVMLQALKEEPPLNTKCKDKFLIQSTIITPEKETMSLQDIWASTDSNEEGKVYQQKLRVTYLPAEGQTLEEEDETAHANMTSIISNTDSHQFDAVRQHPQTNGHHPPPSDFLPPPALEEPRRPSTPPADFSVAREESHEPLPPPVQEVPIVHEPLYRAPTPPTAEFEAPVAEPVVEREVPTSYEPQTVVEPIPAPAPIIITKENPVNEELYVKYKEAQVEIERLRNELATVSAVPPLPELRRRRVPSDVGSSAETDVQTMVEAPLQQEGVPLNVVVLIALGVFVTTYLFF